MYIFFYNYFFQFIKFSVVIALFLIGDLFFSSESLCLPNQHIEHMTEFNQYPFIKVPLRATYWRIQYTGDGYVLFDPDGSGDMILKPKVVSDPSQTLSTLVSLIEAEKKPLKNYIVKLEVTTVQQLREGTAPNDWEVFWFFGNLKLLPDDTKKTNYFLMKPKSGTELGTASGKTNQTFLLTNSDPLLSLGKREKWIIFKKDSRFKVYRDKNLILDYKDLPYSSSLYKHAGTFGLYTEDAYVRVHSFAYSRL